MVSDIASNAKKSELLLSVYDEMVGLNLFCEKSVFETVQNHVRALLGNPTLNIGISVFFQKGAKKSELIRLMMLDHQYKKTDIKNIYRDAIHYSDKHYEQSVYHTYVDEKFKIIEDFAKLNKSGIDNWLMRRGVCGMVLVPLRNAGQLLGFLELTSTSTISPQSIEGEVLDRLTPAFTNTVSAFLLALKSELHGLIQKHFTAIHPTVEWMFEDLAIEWLKGEDDSTIVSPILLEKIYCLYGSSDIRASSDQRRSAIQKDICKQVEMAQIIIQKCLEVRPFDQFRYLNYRLDFFRTMLSDTTIKVNDENSVVQFLREEVEVLFGKINAYSPEISELSARYQENLSEGKDFYNHRRNFESSIHNLNLALNHFVSTEQDNLQKFYPHYFEKHITDGVDHNIFVGSAMDFSKNFSPFHLKSLKIWQLKLLCQSALLGEKVKKHLSLPLELAHLIVSQSDPVTIYFDLQEKKFKVEGTYNIRFEIVKKRIDKALIKNTRERLTQPGTVAVVYSLDKDRDEYLNYFDFLHSSGFVKPNYGDYVLDDMQGIQGLRALRIEVDLKTLADKVDMDSILGSLYGTKP